MYNTFAVRFSCDKGKMNKDGLSPILIFITINKAHTVIQTRYKEKPEDFKKLYNSRIANPVKTFCDNERGAVAGKGFILR